MILKVPYFRQKNSWYCGPASLQMVFAYFGKRVTQTELAKSGETTKTRGTKTKMLPKIARWFGFWAFTKKYGTNTDLKKYLQKKLPPIIEYIEPSENESHHAVVIGFNEKNIILNDPWNGRGFRLPIREFIKRWQKRNCWFMIVKRPRSSMDRT